MINNYNIYTLGCCYQWEFNWHLITNAVVQKINQFCQRAFSAEYITESAFQCFPNSEQQVTFWARLHGTVQVTSSQLIAFWELFFPNRLHHCCTRSVSGCGQQLFHSYQHIWWSTMRYYYHIWQHHYWGTTARHSLQPVGGVIAVIVVVGVPVTVIIAISVIKSHRASFSLDQDAR